MTRFMKNLWLSLLLFMVAMTSTESYAKGPSKKEVLDAMRKATNFMVDNVSNRGGYLNVYTEDFTEQWGEVPARPTQFQIQTVTPDMGMLLLDAYEATGNEYYLGCAEKTANAVIWAQLPPGGWNYMADFDMTVQVNRACHPDEHHTSIFHPYPGTDLYSLCKREGFLENTSMDNVVERRNAVLNLPEFPRREVEKRFVWFSYYVYKGVKPIRSIMLSE